MALGWKKDYLRYRSYFLNILNLYKKKDDVKMYLEIILSLATISFFALFAIKPTFLTISTLLKDIKTKEQTVTKMDTKIKNLKTAEKVLGEEAYRIPIIELSVPQFPQPQTIAHQIEGIASTINVTILGIRIDETSIKGGVLGKNINKKEKSDFPQGVGGMEFSVSAMGSYQGLSLFLKNLENLRIPVKINVLGISLSKREEGNILTLIVTGKVPFVGITETK